MKKLKIIIRVLLMPIYLIMFIFYLPIWYTQMSWYYFNFSDYWDDFLHIINKIRLKLKWIYQKTN